MDRDVVERDASDLEDGSPVAVDSFAPDEACEESRSIAWDRERFAAGATPESELAELTAAGGPLRRTLAAICARLLDTQAIERLCYARLRDYARERAGVSARQLQDLAHAHRAFATLPRLERALVGNELPWSKVRLLVPVATAEDEDCWIERARLLSIRRLEQEVRAVRGPAEGVLDAEAEPPRVHVSLHCTPAVHEQWLLAREFAERVSGQRLREDEALEWVTAEALSAVSIDAARIGEPEAVAPRCVDAAVRDEPPLDKAVRAAAPEALADEAAPRDPLLVGLDEADAFERCLEDPASAQDPIPEDERQLCAPDIDVEATERLAWRAPREVASLFLAVREAVRGRLRAAAERPVSDGEAFSAMLEHAIATWTLRDPSKPRPDPVFERDGYLCAVPGCSSRMSFHDHHVVFRSHQGSNDQSNLLTLCAFHHQRCLHAGRLRIRGFAPDRLVFELGVRPGAPPLARYRSGDVALADPEVPDPTLDGAGVLNGIGIMESARTTTMPVAR